MFYLRCIWGWIISISISHYYGCPVEKCHFCCPLLVCHQFCQLLHLFPLYFSEIICVLPTCGILLSSPSLSTRIVALRFQARGRRRWPNLGLVCVLLWNLCYLYSLVKMDCGVVFCSIWFSLVLCVASVLCHCWLGHLTRKNPSPIWPIMCLVGRSALLSQSINQPTCGTEFKLSIMWGKYLCHEIPVSAWYDRELTFAVCHRRCVASYAVAAFRCWCTSVRSVKCCLFDTAQCLSVFFGGSVMIYWPSWSILL